MEGRHGMRRTRRIVAATAVLIAVVFTASSFAFATLPRSSKNADSKGCGLAA